MQVYLPQKLCSRWSKHIGDDHPKKQYDYCVTAAVHQAGSTREEFQTCWKRYQREGKRGGEKQFREDLFRRFCEAGFGRTTDDGNERKLEFVRRILSEHGEPTQVLTSVQCVCVCVSLCACTYA